MYRITIVISMLFCQLLLDQDVAADTRDKDGMTPAMWACRMDNIDHFGLLTEVCPLPADGDYERDNNGRSWMHWSIRRTEPLECLKVEDFVQCLLNVAVRKIILMA